MLKNTQNRLQLRMKTYVLNGKNKEEMFMRLKHAWLLVRKGVKVGLCRWFTFLDAALALIAEWHTKLLFLYYLALNCENFLFKSSTMGKLRQGWYVPPF